MSKDLERLALAMRRGRFERTGRGPIFDPDVMLTHGEIDDVRAILTELREPSADAEEVGYAVASEHVLGDYAPASAIAHDIWQAMIDSILKE